ELAQEHGYPQLTAEVKAKVFGLNAAKIYGIDPEAQRCAIQQDDVDQMRDQLRNMRGQDALPHWTNRQPIDRRGVLRYFASIGGSWSPWR
ncbi:MAG TPA: hypothetical protein VIH21_05175, partial [Dehalococcoidia bacterium]